MKETWTKPQVTEQEVGLEVTSYLAAEIHTSDILQPTNSMTDCCGSGCDHMRC
jgi:coenzyme PQQ precursor peptide PqqA